MLLRDSLDAAVADVSADLRPLAVASRRRGLSIRRRRRALATIGTAAAVTALAAGGYALLPGADRPDGTVATELTAPATGPLSGGTAPITARGVAAALAAAVDDVADGTFGHFQGDTYDGDGRVQEAMAALLLEPEAGSGPAGQVFLNLQPAAMAGAAPYGCDGYLEDPLTGCTSRRLPNGTTLRTYREAGDTEFGQGSQRVVAQVIDPTHRLLVSVHAMNTNPWADGGFRDRPVLTTKQLTEIATRPWWSRTELPLEYVEAGEQLTDYADATQAD